MTRCFFITDSHAHLTLSHAIEKKTTKNKTIELLNNTLGNKIKYCIKRAVLCGTHPDIDWKIIEKATSAELLTDNTEEECNELDVLNNNNNNNNNNSSNIYSSSSSSLQRVNIIPGFGIHPWFVPVTPINYSDNNNIINNIINDNNNNNETVEQQKQNSQNILQSLEIFLHQHPKAIVGEIGLDKTRGPHINIQISYFLTQCQIAAKYNRPISVHCVRCFGPMLELLRNIKIEEIPPAIILHGFTGSLEFAKAVLGIRKRRPNKEIEEEIINNNNRSISKKKNKSQSLPIYFGIGVNTSLKVKGFVECTLPFLLQERRVLLETDTHHLLICNNNNNNINTTIIKNKEENKREELELGEKEEENVLTENKIKDDLITEIITDDTNCKLVWDTESCKQLAQLLAQVCNNNNNNNNNNNSENELMIETILNSCEEAFTEAFSYLKEI